MHSPFPDDHLIVSGIPCTLLCPAPLYRIPSPYLHVLSFWVQRGETHFVHRAKFLCYHLDLIFGFRDSLP